VRRLPLAAGASAGAARRARRRAGVWPHDEAHSPTKKGKKEVV